jgi:hypothetical protein
MTATLRLDATANQTFRLTLSLADLAQTLALDGVAFRMDARRSGSAAGGEADFTWSSDGDIALGEGVIQLDALRGHIVIVAALKDIRALGGKYDFDLRAELPTGAEELLAEGLLVVARGVTTDPADAASAGVTGVGDTVSVTVDIASLPAALPMSASRVMVAADAARADAQLAAAAAQQAANAAAAGLSALTPQALAASFASLSLEEKAALGQLLLAALPEMVAGEVPVETGAMYIDGSGFLARAG